MNTATTNTAEVNTPFVLADGLLNKQAWMDKCKQIAADAIKHSGLIEYLYVQNTSEGIEAELTKLPKSLAARAKDIARNFGYAIQKEQERNKPDGTCCHGIDPNCCSQGCGDL